MIGRSNARQGARRLFSVLQNPRLNQHLVHTIVDEVSLANATVFFLSWPPCFLALHSLTPSRPSYSLSGGLRPLPRTRPQAVASLVRSKRLNLGPPLLSLFAPLPSRLYVPIHPTYLPHELDDLHLYSLARPSLRAEKERASGPRVGGGPRRVGARKGRLGFSEAERRDGCRGREIQSRVSVQRAQTELEQEQNRGRGS